MASRTASRSRSSGWLFGPGWDLALGCGGAYLVVFAGLGIAGDVVQAAAPYGLLPLLVLVTGIPHYGATLLRVYERPEDRAAYRLFAVWATAAVYAWFVLGVYEVALGSALVTLYLTWSPWHYTAQNYGIAVLFLHRRGAAVSAKAKRSLHLSFGLSYALAFLGIHAEVAQAAYAPVSLAGASYRLIPLGISTDVVSLLLPVVVGAYLASTAAAFLLMRGGGTTLRACGPSLALVGLQALWFSLPVLARASGVGAGWTPFDASLSEYAFLWIAIGHSVQYLWVTTYYAVTSDRAQRRGPYLARTLLVGAAIWGVPLFLFAPDVLGVRSFEAGLALLVAAAVNVHHFILDGAIWKLRDGRIARVLLRAGGYGEAERGEAGGPDAAASGPAPALSWGRIIRPLVAAVGVAYVLATLVATLELEYGVRRSQDPPDVARLREAASRLRWVGRDHADVRYNLGVHALRQGDLETARREIERSLTLHPRPQAWVALGLVEQRSARPRKALAALQKALEADPDNVAALARSARIYARLGERDRAREALSRAVAIAPEREDLGDLFERLGAP